MNFLQNLTRRGFNLNKVKHTIQKKTKKLPAAAVWKRLI